MEWTPQERAQLTRFEKKRAQTLKEPQLRRASHIPTALAGEMKLFSIDVTNASTTTNLKHFEDYKHIYTYINWRALWAPQGIRRTRSSIQKLKYGTEHPIPLQYPQTQEYCGILRTPLYVPIQPLPPPKTASLSLRTETELNKRHHPGFSEIWHWDKSKFSRIAEWMRLWGWKTSLSSRAPNTSIVYHLITWLRQAEPDWAPGTWYFEESSIVSD